jgi:Ca2+/H+ antiporter
MISQLLAFATEEISIRTNQTIAGLLNATLGNAFVSAFVETRASLMSSTVLN